MRIAIVDADLIGHDKHKSPNLVCEKICDHRKKQGASVTLLTDYIRDTSDYDHVYASKVFTDTPKNL